MVLLKRIERSTSPLPKQILSLKIIKLLISLKLELARDRNKVI